jgi:hypothetical protein
MRVVEADGLCGYLDPSVLSRKVQPYVLLYLVNWTPRGQYACPCPCTNRGSCGNTSSKICRRLMLKISVDHTILLLIP